MSHVHTGVMMWQTNPFGKGREWGGGRREERERGRRERRREGGREKKRE